RPIVEVVLGRARKSFGPPRLPEVEKLVFQKRDQLRLLDAPDVGLDEDSIEERDHQRGVVGGQKPPSRMVSAEALQSAEIEIHRRHSSLQLQGMVTPGANDHWSGGKGLVKNGLRPSWKGKALKLGDCLAQLGQSLCPSWT